MLNNSWDFLLELVPKLLLGIIVLLLGYFFARLVKYLVSRFIRYLDKTINGKLNSRQLQVNLGSSRIFIGKVFFWIIIFFSITLFTEVLGLPVITSWLAGFGDYLPRVLAAVVVVVFGIIISRLASDLIKSREFSSGIYSSSVLGRIVKYIIMVITIIIAIDQVGVDIAFLTSLSYILLGALLFGAAVAFGMGAKVSISNILASYYINRTYAVGNLIKIGEQEGKIIKITATSVILEAESGQIHVPAKEFNEQNSILIQK